MGGGNGEAGVTPFLLCLSQLHLELAAHCCRGAEVKAGVDVWVCVCVHKLVLLWDFFLGTPGIQKRKKIMGQGSHRTGNEWDGSQMSLI